MKHFPEKRAQGNLGSFFYPGREKYSLPYGEDISIGRALLNCRGYGSESHSLLFIFYSRLDAKNFACFMEEMSSEQRKEIDIYDETCEEKI